MPKLRAVVIPLLPVNDINSNITGVAMSKQVAKILADMEAGKEIRFNDLAKLCEHYFGKPRQKATSHRTPWPGDPRVNIQNDKGKAKKYQVKQVLTAIAKLKEEAQKP
jgi:hypothetical protein